MTESRICFVGDSFVNGTGDPEYLGWTGRIVAAACQTGEEITAYNLGVRRDTSADILKRWLPEVSHRLPPDCNGKVLFSFGANDITLEKGKMRIDFPDSVNYAWQILEQAKLLFPVLMVSSPPLANGEDNLRLAALSNQFEQICCNLAIPYLDVLTPLQQSPIWMNEVAANDGAHPQAAGYAELAELVKNWVGWTSWINSRKT
jgi:lysophospholipase L1-like esterase